jgi:DNA-binding transcriptional LysR family regulator
MNLRSLDLNLLVVLDALLDEAHVTRAAERIGLSQPAASAALQRCRRLFRDDLLERGRGDMRLTAKAAALRGPLKAILSDVLVLIDPPRVPLAEIRQSVRLVMADYPALLVIPPLLRSLQETAPGIDVAIQPWHGADAALKAIADGGSDLAVSVFPKDVDGIRRTRLFEEHYLVAMRLDHPAAVNFGVDVWLAYPHIVVSGRGETRSPLDDALARMGRSRRVGLVVPTFQMVAPILKATSLLAMLPSRVAAADDALATRPPPALVAGFEIHLARHERSTKDAALNHVAETLTRLLT